MPINFKIKTTLPINTNPSFEFVFKRRQFYKMPVLKTRKLKNVFLTHYGILLKNLLPVKRSLPNAWGFRQPNAGFIFKFYRKAIEVFFVCKFGKSLKVSSLEKQNKYLFVYSPWFGYFSWVTESLPRILSSLNQHEELILLLPESYSKKKFVMQSLEMFPNLKHEIISEGVHMNIPNLVMPELKPFTYTFDPQTMKDFREFVWKELEKKEIGIPHFEKIYVSRKKANNRKLINEPEVLDVLNSKGFVNIAFENYSFWEQVYLMKNCKILAGVHGAGFANIAFMNEGTILYEFIKEYSSFKEERPSYWRLSSALNIKYMIHYCKPVKYGDYDLWVGVDLIADLKNLVNEIDYI